MKYIKEIPEFDILDMDRTFAVIYLDGKVYESDIDHQACLLEIFPHIAEQYGWNMELEEDRAKAIHYTDKAFRDGELFGFDVLESDNEKFLVSHYPQSLENENCYLSMNKYANMYNMSLATYTNPEKLGNICMLVE